MVRGAGLWHRPSISRPVNRRLNPAIPDEAHRSQYGFGDKVNEKTGEMSSGFASNLRDALPDASFLGFTGTPIEKTDMKMSK